MEERAQRSRLIWTRVHGPVNSALSPGGRSAWLVPSGANAHVCFASGASEAHEVLNQQRDKPLIGNQQTFFPPFHRHIRDESPTCMMLSPPASPSIFPADCPGQSRTCTSEVSSRWRGCSVFISDRRALLSPRTKRTAAGPSFISLRWEKPEQGTTESGFRIQV